MDDRLSILKCNTTNCKLNIIMKMYVHVYVYVYIGCSFLMAAITIGVRVGQNQQYIVIRGSNYQYVVVNVPLP